MTDPTKVYWDSCVFVSHIEGTPGRAHDIGLVFAEADSKIIQLFTSTFTVAEVAFAKAERDAGVLDPAIEAAIDDLWAPGSIVMLVEMHFAIAERSRNLMRKAISSNPQRSLKGKDAIHIATAMHIGAEEMHTYDDKLWGYSDMAGFPICAPREQIATLSSTQPQQP